MPDITYCKHRVSTFMLNRNAAGPAKNIAAGRANGAKIKLCG